MFFKNVETKYGTRIICTGEGPRDPVTGKRQQIRRRGKTKKEAKARVQAVIDDIEGRSLADHKIAQNMPFEKLAADWFEFYSVGPKKNTVRKRSKEIKILNRYIPKAPIGKISRRMYQGILVDLAKKGYAKSTISGVHVTANMIFKQAIAWDLLKENPCAGAKIPKKSLTVEEIQNNNIENKYFEDDELKEFLRTVDRYGLYNDKAIFYTLPFSGLRAGELCALKWSDINFENNTLSVTKTIYTESDNMHEYELTPPKTLKSIRKFDMDPDIIDILKKHKLIQARIRLRSQDYHNGNFVIARLNGYPFFPYNIDRRMQRIMKKAHLAKKITPHGLRHTYVCILTELGVDLKSIMERVGHKDMETTLEIYTHVTNKMKKDTVQKVNHFLKDILKKSTV
ncbi:tyrosine-type recombinase/integrase [Sporolactobacillus sp. CQH2019]|uniref:tyrosine-type recombinase/integrase n=1 Tax=Sporolactobacillus sp. CQH2019 TaxID=3023512 RepID=UPI00236756A8|nr:tyrosine-type recombinase/integrase [Sporolactobacillus sp. CQH2019]MDD9147862.1 tyrosine-type recombinase/integrase [Sporolactobacillus sp. CQH2019]